MPSFWVTQRWCEEFARRYEVKMSIHYTFQRWENLQNLEYKIGMEKTSVNEYDKVTLISIPFNKNELFLVSSEPKSNYNDILTKTKSILEDFLQNQT